VIQILRRRGRVGSGGGFRFFLRGTMDQTIHAPRRPTQEGSTHLRYYHY
jgi:hypothetical protein